MGNCKCKCGSCGKEEACEGDSCAMSCCGAPMEKVCDAEEKSEGGCCGGRCG
jgi:hypothetical protein